ncbi:DEAD-box type RNA helicase, partial [Kappamyces sp. JEL0680]
WMVIALERWYEAVAKGGDLFKQRFQKFIVDLALRFPQVQGLDQLALSAASKTRSSESASDEKERLLLRNIILGDLSLVRGFIADGNTPFEVGRVWHSLPKGMRFSLEVQKEFAPLVVSLSFHGPIVRCAVDGHNDAISLVLSSLPGLVPDIERLDLDWKQGLRLLLHNQESLQNAGLHILQSSNRDADLKVVFAYLTYLRKAELLEFFFVLLKKLKDRLEFGVVLEHSTFRLFDVFALLGASVFSSSNGGEAERNLWLHLNIYSYTILGCIGSWEGFLEPARVRTLFRRCITEMRNYVTFRAAAVKNIKSTSSFHLDWAKETILSLKPWIANSSGEVNHLCFQLILDVLATLVDTLKIPLEQEWKDVVRLERGMAHNPSQWSQVERYLCNPMKRTTDVPAVSAAKAVKLLPEASPSKAYGPNPSGGLFTVQPRPAMASSRSISIPKSGKNMSTLEKMRMESRAEVKRLQLSVPKPRVSQPYIPVPEEVEEPKERRPVKFVELKTVRPRNSRGVPIELPSARSGKTAAQLLNVKQFYKTILSWGLNDSELLTGADFKPIPSTFQNASEYVATFEPLFMQECKSQFKQAAAELTTKKSYSLVLDMIRTVGDSQQADFIMSYTDLKADSWNENSLLYMTPTSKDESIVVLVREVKRRKLDSVLVCEFNTKQERASLSTSFRLQSPWTAKLLMSLTTQFREFVALSKLNALALFSSILRPVQQNLAPTSNTKVDQLMRSLNVNEPQAMAIARASEQDSGFVLIQGPPGLMAPLVSW